MFVLVYMCDMTVFVSFKGMFWYRGPIVVSAVPLTCGKCVGTEEDLCLAWSICDQYGCYVLLGAAIHSFGRFLGTRCVVRCGRVCCCFVGFLVHAAWRGCLERPSRMMDMHLFLCRVYSRR